MPRSFFSLLLLFIFANSTGQNRVPVFVSGQEGYQSFRIPAIISAPNGDLLAFAEGRMNHAGDFGNIQIVMKRSTDKGNTWSALQVVAVFDTLQVGNPAPVVDMKDPEYPAGRIFLFYNTGDNHEGEVRKGNGLREVWYKTSTDNGYSWGDTVNITTQVHRPDRPDVNAAYVFKEDWRSYALTPGHAIQLQSGPFAGRIFVAANHSAGPPQNRFTDYAAHGFFSDDHGKTFHLAETVSLPGSNESTAAELFGGRLMMNSRNQQGDVKRRVVSISNDGGAIWDTTYFDQNLPDPVNQGSILTVGTRRGKNIVAFSHAASDYRRDSLTLRISFDDGKTWKRKILIDSSPDAKGDFTAYSDLVKMAKNKIGVLYERHNYKEIVFTVIDWARKRD